MAKKQVNILISTMKSEFVAASEQAREQLGIREMLSEIGKSPALPILLHIDN